LPVIFLGHRNWINLFGYGKVETADVPAEHVVSINDVEEKDKEGTSSSCHLLQAAFLFG
jgi:hypothetical protein